MDSIQPGILGIRPYAPGTPIEEAARRLGRSPEEFVKMASNENPLGMSPMAAAAVRERLSRASAYPEIDSPGMRAALSSHLGIGADHLITGNGADGVLYAYFMTLIDQGDEVVVPELTFSVYETVVRAMRGTVVTSPMRSHRIDLQDILDRITRRTKVVVVCNPNNPTGDLLSASEWRGFLDSVPPSVHVALDEVYFDFSDPEAFPDSVGLIANGKKNLFVFRSLSKIYGLAGVRAGYGIGDPQLISFLYRVRPPFDVSILASVAAVAALGDRAFYRQTLDLTTEGKRYLYTELDRMALEYVESHANFVFLDTRRNSKEVYDGMLERGVIVRAGYPLAPTHIRVTVGLPEHNRRFIQALGEVV